MDAQANIAHLISRIAILGPYLPQIWVPISELTVLINSFGLLSAINPV